MPVVGDNESALHALEKSLKQLDGMYVMASIPPGAFLSVVLGDD